eukprot:m.856941 g.856941  ORF g.856941 m.856941 type:complete len:879 (-) comp23518_c0_seq6:247-2883(-)
MAGSATVFRTQEFWVSPAPHDEEAVKNLCVDMQGLDIVHLPSLNENFIVIGTYAGRLRVYRPSENPFSEQDVIVDSKMEHPILGVHCDHDIIGVQSASVQPLIALLHPKMVVVYELEVSSTNSSIAHGDSAQNIEASLKKLHQHDLKESAATMVYGRFREAQGGLAACVQSMRANISMWEQGQLAFTTSLECTVAGPMCYVPSTGSFVTVTAAFHAEAYTLMALQSSENAVCDWSVNLGEDALQVEYAQTDPPTIVVLGVKTMFWLEVNGTIRHSKRLEGSPSCMHVYGARGHSVDVLVAMHTRHIVVLRDTRVLWAAGVDAVPVAVAVATVGGHRGMIVAMDERGGVGCYYLGTDPVLTVQPSFEDRDIDYDAMDRQMAELQASIREMVLAEQPEASTQGATTPITVTGVVSAAACDAGGVATIDLSVTAAFRGAAGVGEVDVCFVTSSPEVAVHPQCVSLKAGAVQSTGTSIQATVTCRDMGTATVPPCVFVDVIAMPRDSTRGAVGSHRIHLPWVHSAAHINSSEDDGATGSELVLLRRQQKQESLTSSDNDVTVAAGDLLHVNVYVSEYPPGAGSLRSPEELLRTLHAAEGTSLGPSVSAATSPEVSGADGSAVLDMPNGATAVIAVTDTTTYTISTDAVGALGVALSCLERAILRAYPQPPVLHIPAQDVPFESYFRTIEHHFVVRQHLNELYAALDKQAEQIRVVQRRLMTRYTDKTPAPLDALDFLLDTAYNNMLEVAEKAESAQQNLARANSDVSAATRTMVDLLRICHALDEENTGILESALFVDFENATEDEGWEERVDAALVFLLKKNMSSQPRDVNRVEAFTIPDDVEPLKRHFRQLCEKLAQGIRLDGRQKLAKTVAEQDPIQSS